jgi:2-dehydro-3-deoxyphosphogluconate aldolase/(4S)-4-hydroxy-2-oxoglutarate aldolase
VELTAERLLSLGPVVPVLTLESADDAVPVAQALVDGGLRAIEVTLRTSAAPAAIERIAENVPDAVVGAGTVLSQRDAKLARRAGARFLVAPGSTQRLLEVLESSGLPFLAGVSTPSEVLRLVERGIFSAKLFPAEAAGGVALLRALHGPFPGVRFCPTGGIAEALASTYLELPNVACVGGSWMCTPAMINARDWASIQSCAEASAALGAAPRPEGASGDRKPQPACDNEHVPWSQ